MIITQIKKIGRGDRYSIYCDDVFFMQIETEILVKNKLKTGQEISEEQAQNLKLQNGDFASFDKALSYIERGIKTEKNIRDYLKKKGYLEESVNKAVDKLLEYGYINDEVYAENYISTYSQTKGKQKLKFDLLSKGVDKSIIDQKLEKLLDEEGQFESAKTLALKFLKNKIRDEKTYQKLCGHLVSKGFSFDVVSKIAKVVLKEERDESWD